MFQKSIIILGIVIATPALGQVESVTEQEWDAVREPNRGNNHTDKKRNDYWVNPILTGGDEENTQSIHKKLGNAVDLFEERGSNSTIAEQYETETNWDESDIENLPEWETEDKRYAFHSSPVEIRKNNQNNRYTRVSRILKPTKEERIRRQTRLNPYLNQNSQSLSKTENSEETTSWELLRQLNIPEKGTLTFNAALPHKVSDKGHGYKFGMGVKFPKYFIGLMIGNIWKGIENEKETSFMGYGLNIQRRVNSKKLVRFSAGTAVGYWTFSESENFNNIVGEYYLMPNARVELGKTISLFWDIGGFVGTDLRPMMNLGITTDIVTLRM